MSGQCFEDEEIARIMQREEELFNRRATEEADMAFARQLAKKDEDDKTKSPSEAMAIDAGVMAEVDMAFARQLAKKNEPATNAGVMAEADIALTLRLATKDEPSKTVAIKGEVTTCDNIQPFDLNCPSSEDEDRKLPALPRKQHQQQQQLHQQQRQEKCLYPQQDQSSIFPSTYDNKIANAQSFQRAPFSNLKKDSRIDDDDLKLVNLYPQQDQSISTSAYDNKIAHAQTLQLAAFSKLKQDSRVGDDDLKLAMSLQQEEENRQLEFLNSLLTMSKINEEQEIQDEQLARLMERKQKESTITSSDGTTIFPPTDATANNYSNNEAKVAKFLVENDMNMKDLQNSFHHYDFLEEDRFAAQPAEAAKHFTETSKVANFLLETGMSIKALRETSWGHRIFDPNALGAFASADNSATKYDDDNEKKIAASNTKQHQQQQMYPGASNPTNNSHVAMKNRENTSPKLFKDQEMAEFLSGTGMNMNDVMNSRLRQSGLLGITDKVKHEQQRIRQFDPYAKVDDIVDKDISKNSAASALSTEDILSGSSTQSKEVNTRSTNTNENSSAVQSSLCRRLHERSKSSSDIYLNLYPEIDTASNRTDLLLKKGVKQEDDEVVQPISSKDPINYSSQNASSSSLVNKEVPAQENMRNVYAKHRSKSLDSIPFNLLCEDFISHLDSTSKSKRESPFKRFLNFVGGKGNSRRNQSHIGGDSSDNEEDNITSRTLLQRRRQNNSKGKRAIPTSIPDPISPPNRRQQSSPQTGQFSCSRCGQKVTKFVLAKDKRYHVNCFRCIACNKLIDPNSVFVFTLDHFGEEQPIHRHCFADRFGIECVVCKKKIPVGLDGNTEFVKHRFFQSEQMCFDCEVKPSLRRCAGCQRFEPTVAGHSFTSLNDGNRCICDACRRTAIMDNENIGPLWDEVITFFGETMKLPVWDTMKNTPVLIVGQDALNDQQQTSVHGKSKQMTTRRICISEYERGRGFRSPNFKFNESSSSFECECNEEEYTYFTIPKANETNPSSSVLAILCLSGLPRDLTASVLAHEATHAWIKMHPDFDLRKSIPPQVEEGVAQLIAFLFLNNYQRFEDNNDKKQSKQPFATIDTSITLNSYNNNNNALADISVINGSKKEAEPTDEKLRQYFKYTIETSEDNVYGEGFRKAAAAYAKIGIEALMSYIVLCQEFPLV